jgi:hypothetical protein
MAYESPACDCDDCRDDEEAGCATTMFAAPDGHLVQCGLPGRHDGSCDYWEKPHPALLRRIAAEAAAKQSGDRDRGA